MGQYAAQTSVSSEKSKNEIERTVVKYGATQFLYAWKDDKANVCFRMNGRTIRFDLPLPDRWSDAFRLTPGRRVERSEKDVERAYEQAVRQRWRALALCIKAKLEAVEAGIVEFDTEFLAHTVLPGGQTVGDWARPQLDGVLIGGCELPKLLTA